MPDEFVTGTPPTAIQVAAMAEVDPVEARRRELRCWLSSDEVEIPWREAFMARLQAGKRDAIRLRVELMDMLGSQRDLVMGFLAGYGLRSAQEFAQIVERVRSVDGMDAHASYRACLAYVTDYRRDHGLAPLVASGEATERAVLPASGANAAGHGPEVEP